MEKVIITTEMKTEFEQQFGMKITEEITMAELMMRYPRYRKIINGYNATYGLQYPLDQQVVLTAVITDGLDRLEAAATKEDAVIVLTEVMTSFAELGAREVANMYGNMLNEEDLQVMRGVMKGIVADQVKEMEAYL